MQHVHTKTVTTVERNSVTIHKKDLFAILARALASEGIQLGAPGTVTFGVGYKFEVDDEDMPLVVEWETRKVEEG